MVNGQNYLLEYVIDNLLKNFNPNRRPIMKRVHFFKMMDILDYRLKKQNIDIKYPSYWYKYGSVADLNILDMVIPRGFITRYFNDSENVLYPYQHRERYEINLNIKRIIDLTISAICGQYRYKDNYGVILKKESYKLNSPYKYNTIFQDYIVAVTNENSTLTSREDLLENLLNQLLNEFPEDDYPELIDINLEWDDTTRLVLHCLDGSQQQEITTSLMYLFWDLYSKGIRIKYNQNIPDTTIHGWKEQYNDSLPSTYKQIEEIRNNLFLESTTPFETDAVFAKKLLKKAHEIACDDKVL